MMRYKGYLGDVEYDPDAKVFCGEVIGIRDVVTFEGTSVEEIERAFRQSVDDYLAFCRQRGERPDKAYSGQFLVRMDPSLHRRASAVAQISDKSLNALVTEAVAREVEQKWPVPTRPGQHTPKGGTRRRKTRPRKVK